MCDRLLLKRAQDRSQLVCIREGLGPFMFSLSIQLGHPDSHYQELAAKENMDRLQLEVDLKKSLDI